jgi:quercetin dioxygenase-like cupin family protein
MEPSAAVRAGRIGAGASIAAVILATLVAGQEPTPPRSRVAFAQALPALDGSRLEATVVDVTYEPGGSNAAHRHPCPVIGYVIEGSVRIQVKGQAERIYTPGETFYEAPTDVHVVSANASPDKPARFLAYFVCDRKTPLSVPVADSPSGRR